MANEEIPIAIELAKKQREISVASFFEKNRHLLGFDNPRKSLLTTIKEAVDNSLDACEEANVLPEISIEIIEMAENKFRVIVEDNGPGIVKKQIPNIFAKLLYGSKFFKLSQSRGQQGIGISASVLYAQLTTGKPARITSRIGKKHDAHYYELRIDTYNNKPEIVKDEAVKWEKEHGTRIELDLEGSYQKGDQSVDQYLKQTAIVNPHITLIYTNPKAEQIIFPRASETMPKKPVEIKPHPYGVEIGILMSMLKLTEARTLQSFLMNEFSRVGSGTAKQICGNAAMLPGTKPKDVNRDMAEKLIEGIKKTKIIAPPVDCISPITEDLLEKGLRKEINAEFYAAVTRPPAVYRGNPFIVECCTGDTQLTLEDGELINIKDYVENRNFKKVFAMGKDFKIVPVKVLAVQKFKNLHKILKITTRTGRSLKVTSNNELPIIENGEVRWIKAEDVMVSDYIAAPRKLDTNSQIPRILDILNSEHVKVMDHALVKGVMSILRKKYGTLKSAASELNCPYENFKSLARKKCIGRPNLTLFKRMLSLANLKYEEFKNKIETISYVDNKYNNPVPIKIPEINEDLLYLLGLLNSDGYITKACIVFVNNDQSLHDSFGKKIKSLFNLNVKRYRKTETHISNKTLYTVLKQAEKILPKLPTNLVISWLKGYADGDGYPHIENGKIKSVGISTAKYEKAKLVQTLMLRLGIISKIEVKKPSNFVGLIGNREVKSKAPQYNIIIENFENIKKFADIISFRHINRANILSKAIKEAYDTRSQADIVPVGNSIRSLIRQENELYQYELGFSDQTIRQIEKGNQNLTRIHLQQIVSNPELKGFTLEKLKLLAFSDILWDKIVSIELMPHEEYVYDLTTETGNFAADNIIMHNCGIAYGGEQSAEESMKLFRYANRVPLLYQQGACAVTRSVINTAWRNYGLSQSRGALPIGPVTVAVHIASVWVPFTSESKEAIAHYPEIIKEIKLALQECGRKLASYVGKKRRMQFESKKRDYIQMFIPHVGQALKDLVGLSESDEKKIEKMLAEILEKKRGKLEEVEAQNLEYDEEFAKIGEGENEEDEKEEDK